MEPKEKKEHPLTALAFLRVGILEIGFVIIVLLLIFGTLNYFNILYVSDAFPKYLGWLPRQTKTVPQGEALQNYSPVSSPTPQGLFQYDAKKAETLLAQYIKNEIKPELLLTAPDIEQGLEHGRQTDVKYQFGSNFIINNATISANFHFKENATQQNDSNIFITLEIPTISKATTSLANSLLSAYFANPYPITECQTKGVKSYCENFKSLSNGNRGYGILLGYDPTKPLMSIVFTCFIPKDSTYYNALKSCISP